MQCDSKSSILVSIGPMLVQAEKPSVKPTYLSTHSPLLSLSLSLSHTHTHTHVWRHHLERESKWSKSKMKKSKLDLSLAHLCYSTRWFGRRNRKKLETWECHVNVTKRKKLLKIVTIIMNNVAYWSNQNYWTLKPCFNIIYMQGFATTVHCTQWSAKKCIRKSHVATWLDFFQLLPKEPKPGSSEGPPTQWNYPLRRN